MKIKDTELEYYEADATALDYYLGSSYETKEQWAKRVWDNCKEYAETNGMGYNPTGKKMPSVYAQCPHCLWENKKRRRRAAMMKEFTGKECDKKLLDMENVKKDVINKRECNWDYEFSDAKVMEIKNGNKHIYKTATERHNENKLKEKEMETRSDNDVRAKVSKLKKKFDDETIAIIYPQGKKFLNKGAISTIPKVGKK